MASRKRNRRNARAVPSRTPRRGGLLVLIGLAAVAVAIVAALAWRYVAQARLNDGPVVLISIDTLRADCLPAYGYSRVRTPFIDAFARDAIVFERAYSHSPQTLPAHTSIFSGRLPFEHGVRDNVGFTVRKGERLLPAMLKERGYASGGFASAFVLRKDSGIAQGFDTYDGEITSSRPEESMGRVQRDGSVTIAMAEKWLTTRDTPRFFLFLHLYEPHKPYRPPARYAIYGDPYDGEIAYADELVGRFLKTLEERGLYDAATIILLSDHGEGLGDHGEQEHGVFLYDESIRIPLIMKLPGNSRGGTRVTAPVQHIDLLPTILDLVGGSRPEGLRGRSLRALLDGGQMAAVGVYSEAMYPQYHFGWSPLYGWTNERYRYIRAPKPELYDLSRDPDERVNLMDQRRATAESMNAALGPLVKGASDDRPQQVSAEELEKFQALGYIGTTSPESPAPESVAIDPKDKIQVLEMYRHAVTLRSERRLAEAIDVYRKILADNPGMVDIWQQLAGTLLRIGRTAEAVEALRRVISLRPESTEALLSITHAFLRLQRYDEARRHAELVVARDPARGYEVLARLAVAQRRFGEAVAYARRTQEEDPTLPMAPYVQGLVHYERGEYEQALSYFRQAADALGKGMVIRDLHFQMGDALARLERPREAEAEFKEELRQFPESMRARASLALLYHSEGRVQEANATLMELLRSVPAAESYALVAQTLNIVGDRNGARSVLARGLSQFPADRQLRALANR